MKKITQFILVIVIAGGAGFALQRYTHHEDSQIGPSIPKAVNNQVIGLPHPTFELMDIEGEKRHSKEWNGKVVLVNFWATWCPPCKKEMPAFMELQEQYGSQGFQVVGIALDDEQSVRDFADTLGINYPVLVAEFEGIGLSRAYGNHMGALPYSVFIDRNGHISLTQTGELNKQQVEQIINPMLEN